MTNWFHRNPIKATAPVKFDLGLIATDIKSRSICSELAATRESILKMLSDPSVASHAVLSKAKQYVSLFMGFINPPENSQDTQSKLRSQIMFKWTDSVKPKDAQPTMERDAMFELCSMLFAIALWFMKHAAKVSSSENVSVEEAKDVHTSLRYAAGIFTELKTKYVPNLLNRPAEYSDLCSDILEAYIRQCMAEAHEVTVARAIELKHDPALIGGLAKYTSTEFENASLALNVFDVKDVGKWLKYLEFKRYCYLAYALMYYAQHLLKLEKVGDALAVIAQAEGAHKLAINAGKQYTKAQGVGLSAKPAEHCFFRRLGTLIDNTRKKLERENGLIFHQRIAATAPEFNLNAEYGIASPELPDLDFKVHERWKDAYVSFDESKLLSTLVNKDERKMKSDRDAKVESIPEKLIFPTDKDPKNESGCVLS